MPSQVSRRSPLSSSSSQPSSVVSSTSSTPATSRNLSTMTGNKPPPPPSNKAADNDELFSNDEVTVYKDEGESDEQQASENLTEIKLGLVTETEEASSPSIDVDRRSYSEDDASSCTGPKHASDYILPLGCPSLVTSPFIGTDHKPPAANIIQKTIFGDVRKSSLGLYMCGTCPDGLAHPPPAHMGIPPLHIDPKTGLPSYSLQNAAAASSLLYGSDLTSLHFDLLARSTPYTPSHLQAWFTSPPSPTAAPGILSSHPGISYPSSVGFGLPSDLSLFSVDNIDGSSNRRFRDRTNGSHGGNANGTGNDVMTADLSCLSTAGSRQRKPYIKKPLNAFMLFMKEMRQKVIDECTLKESAAINQILGRKWHALDRAEQARYYEMARKEKELHMQLYPGWSARDNYATRTKKKKLKRTTSSINGVDFGYVRSSSSSQFCTSSTGIDCTVSSTVCQNARKCRIHYGLDQQSRWCHVCRVDYDSASENRPSSSRSETVQVVDDLCMSSSGHGLHCRPVN